MLVKDLICDLVNLIEKQPDVRQWGPEGIMIDVFRPATKEDTGPFYVYAGFSDKVDIHRSGDWVYPILNAFVNDLSDEDVVKQGPKSSPSSQPQVSSPPVLEDLWPPPLRLERPDLRETSAVGNQG